MPPKKQTGKKVLRLLLTAFFVSASLFAISPQARADGGQNVLYFYCEKNNFLEIKGLVLFDITPVLNKRTFAVDRLQPGQEVQECQLSPSDKVVVHIGANPAFPQHDNVEIKLNGEYIDDFGFENPDHIHTYYFGKTGTGELRIDHTESAVENEKKEVLTPEENAH